MKKILVIFSGTRDNIGIVEKIFEREGEDIFLKIFFILSDVIPSSFSTWLMYMGFLGEEPTEEIRDLIIKEIEKDLREKKEEIENFLKNKKAKFEIEFLKGDFRMLLKEIMDREKFDSIYTSKAQKVIIGEESIKGFNIREI